MASYKGVVVSPSLTQTAGGKNLYVPSAAGSGPEVILGDVDITGDLEVQGGAVSIVQTDRVTPSSAATLSLSGGLGAGGAAGGSKYTFYKGCGPLGSGVIYQDHLQLFRFGPTGAVQPTLSQVLDIAPKMVADSSPAQNLMSVFADVTVGGKLAVSGAATVGGLRAGGVASGSFTGVLPVNTSVTILNITQPCFLEVFAQANPFLGDERYMYQQIAVLGAVSGGNRFIGANGAGLTVAGSNATITAVNGTPGSPTAYGTPVTISLNSVSGGGAAQTWSGSWRVIAIPDPFGTYTGAIATQTQSYSVPV